jgi:BRCA1-associated protein
VFPHQRSRLLCCLGVPSYMTTSDFLSFVGSFRHEFSHVRIVRDSSPNKYMVLLTFLDQRTADAFFMDFNGRQFSSLEPELCHLVYIERIEVFEVCENRLFWSQGQPLQY